MAMSEEEQIERLQGWWRENGTSLVAAIVVAVAAIVGWRHYQELERTGASAASAAYEQMTTAIQQAAQAPESEAPARAEASANTLIEEHSNSVYADFARLFLARLAVEKNNLEQARTLLTEVEKDAHDPALAWTARLRLARIELEVGNTDAALALLDQTYPDAFSGQALELKGDALRESGDLAGARTAYREALETLSAAESRRLVQMKLDDLVPAS